MTEKQSTSGQVVIEILIAVAVAATIIGAAILVVFSSQSLATKGAQESQAIHLAHGELESARAIARGDFATLGSVSSTEGIYTIERIVEEEAQDTKKTTTKVSWSDFLGRTQEVFLTALFTNWRIEEDTGGDTGGGGISGDWKNPRTLGQVNLGPGNQATGLDVINKIVYIVAQASDEKKDDFFVVDATDGENPTIVSSTSTGPGINAIDATSDFAYVANNQTSEQLQVLDIRDQNDLKLHASLTLPGVSGSGAVGNSIFYFDKIIYIGTQAADGPEFHVVDVSNPTNPTALGSAEVGADVASIMVKGGYAYIATGDETQELKIFNISNPADITQEGLYDAPGDSDGLSVFISGSLLYLGRETSSDEHLLIFDLSDAVDPVLLGSTGSVEGAVRAMYVREGLAFLGTDDANDELQIYNVEDPENIEFWSSFNFPQEARDIDYEDNLVYVAVRSNDALRIITSQ